MYPQKLYPNVTIWFFKSSPHTYYCLSWPLVPAQGTDVKNEAGVCRSWPLVLSEIAQSGVFSHRVTIAVSHWAHRQPSFHLHTNGVVFPWRQAEALNKNRRQSGQCGVRGGLEEAPCSLLSAHFASWIYIPLPHCWMRADASADLLQRSEIAALPLPVGHSLLWDYHLQLCLPMTLSVLKRFLFVWLQPQFGQLSCQYDNNNLI